MIQFKWLKFLKYICFVNDKLSCCPEFESNCLLNPRIPSTIFINDSHRESRFVTKAFKSRKKNAKTSHPPVKILWTWRLEKITSLSLKYAVIVFKNAREAFIFVLIGKSSFALGGDAKKESSNRRGYSKARTCFEGTAKIWVLCCSLTE